ncbi:MAG TPA: cytochrome P450 [Solirubrobacteraceae bacterium]|jgi:cytochrome P450|nr:cytochrome P450 [Solirubrobacteraceae bacterium]
MSATPVATDLHTFAFWGQPREQREAAFRWLRENDPVSWHPPAESLLMPPDENSPGFWAITKHAHIQEISRNPKVFSSASGIFLEDLPPEAGDVFSFIHLDAPAHTQLRGIVQSAFSPRNMRKMNDWLHEHARAVVAEMAPKGQGDLVEDLAKPLPGRVYAHYIGVEDDAVRERVTRAALQVVAWNEEEHLETMTPLEVIGSAAQELSAVALELAEHRRVTPGDDMLTWLVQAQFEGRRMTDDEIARFFTLLAGAVNDTTGHTIGNAFILLERHPDQKALLLEDFDNRIEGAVEEILRYRPPIVHFRRTALEDYELAGKRIEKGDKVILWYLSGSRDEDVFEDPDRFDITRTNNTRHQAFGGGGPHFCIGAELGRRLVREAIREVYTQMPDVEIGEPTYAMSNFLNNVKSLPASWTPTG